MAQNYIPFSPSWLDKISEFSVLIPSGYKLLYVGSEHERYLKFKFIYFLIKIKSQFVNHIVISFLRNSAYDRSNQICIFKLTTF